MTSTIPSFDYTTVARALLQPQTDDTKNEYIELLARQLVLSIREHDCSSSEETHSIPPGFTIVKQEADRTLCQGWCRLIQWHDQAGVVGVHIAHIIARARYGSMLTDEKLRQTARAIDEIIETLDLQEVQRWALDLALMTRVPLALYQPDGTEIHDTIWVTHGWPLVHWPSRRRVIVHGSKFYEIDDSETPQPWIPAVDHGNLPQNPMGGLPSSSGHDSAFLLGSPRAGDFEEIGSRVEPRRSSFPYRPIPRRGRNVNDLANGSDTQRELPRWPRNVVRSPDGVRLRPRRERGVEEIGDLLRSNLAREEVANSDSDDNDDNGPGPSSNVYRWLRHSPRTSDSDDDDDTNEVRLGSPISDSRHGAISNDDLMDSPREVTPNSGISTPIASPVVNPGAPRAGMGIN